LDSLVDCCLVRCWFATHVIANAVAVNNGTKKLHRVIFLLNEWKKAILADIEKLITDKLDELGKNPKQAKN